MSSICAFSVNCLDSKSILTTGHASSSTSTWKNLTAAIMFQCLAWVTLMRFLLIIEKFLRWVVCLYDCNFQAFFDIFLKSNCQQQPPPGSGRSLARAFFDLARAFLKLLIFSRSQITQPRFLSTDFKKSDWCCFAHFKLSFFQIWERLSLWLDLASWTLRSSESPVPHLACYFEQNANFVYFTTAFACNWSGRSLVSAHEEHLSLFYLKLLH